jgi:hypothetical protein
MKEHGQLPTHVIVHAAALPHPQMNMCVRHTVQDRLMVMDAGVARRLSRGFPLVVVHNLSKRPPKAGTGILFQKDVHRDTVGSLGSSCVWLGITSQRIPCVDCVGVWSMLLFAYARLEYNCKGTHQTARQLLDLLQKMIKLLACCCAAARIYWYGRARWKLGSPDYICMSV